MQLQFFPGTTFFTAELPRHDHRRPRRFDDLAVLGDQIAAVLVKTFRCRSAACKPGRRFSTAMQALRAGTGLGITVLALLSLFRTASGRPDLGYNGFLQIPFCSVVLFRSRPISQRLARGCV